MRANYIHIDIPKGILVKCSSLIDYPIGINQPVISDISPIQLRTGMVVVIRSNHGRKVVGGGLSGTVVNNQVGYGGGGPVRYGVGKTSPRLTVYIVGQCVGYICINGKVQISGRLLTQQFIRTALVLNGLQVGMQILL